MMKCDVLFPSLGTPAVLVDMDKLEANIREMTHLAADAGVRLRLHTKIHQSVTIAKMGFEEQACGIEVGPIDQAEPMVEGGVNDVLVAHPFYGKHKLEKLKRILSRWPNLKLTVLVDMIEQAEGISRIGQAVGRKVPVLLKIDVNAVIGGFSRLGVLPGKPALHLSKKLCRLPGIEFMGVYAHEMPSDKTPQGLDKAAFETASLMVETAKLLRKDGIPVEHISMGASNTFRDVCRYIKEGRFPDITELHPGAFIIGDIMHMRTGCNTRETCTVTVLTTVVSTSHPNMAVIDAGYKTFGADYIIGAVKEPDFFWNGLPSFGSIQGRPDLRAGLLGAETGYIYYTDENKKLSLGERLEIVPNNATLVINIHDQLYGVRNDVVETVIPVTGRGKGN